MKKLLALVLVLMMMLSLLPMQALAAYAPGDQVRVIVENTTFTTAAESADGNTPPAWSGTLLDANIDISDPGMTMMDAIAAALETQSIPSVGLNSGYISSINGLAEFNGKGIMCGWMGTLNDWFTNMGFDNFTVEDGDVVRVMYTNADNGGEDLGASWNNNNKQLDGLAFSAGTLTPVFTADGTSYTLTLPAGTNSVSVSPTAANKNFQVRVKTSEESFEDVRWGTRTLAVADGETITVTCGDIAWPSMNDSNGGGTSGTVPGVTYTIAVSIESLATAEVPSFTADLSATPVHYATGQAADPLTVVADVEDSGSVTYQWYSSVDNSTFTPVDGATSAMYTPSTTAVGTTYYRVVATNNLGESTTAATSSVATVTVNTVTSVQVEITAQGEGMFLFAPQSATVSSNLAETYGYSDSVSGVSALDALVYAHELALGTSFAQATAGDFLVVSAAGSVTKSFGVPTMSIGFAVNGISPNDGVFVPAYNGNTGYTIKQAEIQTSDLVEFYFYEDDYWMDQYVWFSQSGAITDSINATAGTPTALMLEGYYIGLYGCNYTSLADAAAVKGAAIEDAQLALVNASTGALTNIDGAITDEDGAVSVTFPAAGTYLLTAYMPQEAIDEYYASPVILPLATVTVSAAANSAPAVKAGVANPAAVTVSVNEPYSVDLATIFEDADGDALTYTISVNGAAAEATTATYTITPTESSVTTLTFRANDGQADSEAYTVTLTAESLNKAPVIKDGVANPAAVTVSVNKPYSVDLATIFEDAAGDALTYTVVVNGAAPEATGSAYSFTPAEEGVTTLVFTANDGKAYSVSYTVALTAVQTVPLTVRVGPSTVNVTFYATTGYDANGYDLFDASSPLAVNDGGVVSNYRVYTVDVPAAVQTISFRGTDAAGNALGGMTVDRDDAVDGTVTLCQFEGYISTKIDGVYPTDAQAVFVVKDADNKSATYGSTYVNTSGYTRFRFLMLAGGNAELYTYQAVPQGALAQTYGNGITTSVAFFPSTSGGNRGLTLPKLFTYAITAPNGANVQIFNQLRNFYAAEIDKTGSTDNDNGTTTHTFKLPGGNANLSYRVSMSGCITKAGWLPSLTADVSKTFSWTESDPAPSTRTNNVVTSVAPMVEESLLLNVNAQNFLELDTGETFRLRAYRIWQIVNNITANIMIEPDFHYNVISGGDVVSITPVTSGNGNAINNWLDITALSPGTAIIEVSYDAITVDGATYNGTFAATDPWRTGLLVIHVGPNGTAEIDLGMSRTFGAQTQGWDAEFDTVYFYGDSGTFSFTPDAAGGGITGVEVLNNPATNSAWTALTPADGVYTATILPGNNILRITSGDTVEYQIVRGATVTAVLSNVTHPNEAFHPGDNVSLFINGLYMPIPKFSGIYNPAFGSPNHKMTYTVPSGMTLVSTVSGNQYNLRVKNGLTVRSDTVGAYTLTGGYIYFTMMGNPSPIGQHRTLTDTGVGANFNAAQTYHNRNVLPDVTIAVQGYTTAVTFDVTPANATVAVADSNSVAVTPNPDGTYTLNDGATYSYTVSAPAYVTKTGTITPAGNTTVTVTLQLENTLPNYTGDWTSFRGNDENMGVTSAQTPITANESYLKWAMRVYTTPPIILNGELYAASGNKVYRLDKNTGETLAVSNTLAGNIGFALNPITYAEGMLFVPITNGRIQALNAETLESLWISEEVGGQTLCPITYKNGYIFGGTWNSETTAGIYYAITVADEDPVNGTETKPCAWKLNHTGGFYWAGAYATDNYVVFGSDDGSAQYNFTDTAVLYSVNPTTGAVIDTITGIAGDIRSTVSAVVEGGKTTVYFTTKGGVFAGVEVGSDGQFKDNTYKTFNLGGMSTGTPLVFNGVAFIGVAGSSQFSPTGHSYKIIDVSTMQLITSVDTIPGYVQTSALLSTAYYEATGKVYVYLTYNYTPGGVYMIEYDMNTRTAMGSLIFDPTGTAYAQYCICSLVCDSDGTIYYKNDSGYLMAVARNPAYLTSLTCNAGSFKTTFSPKTMNYELAVPNGTESVTLDMTAFGASTITVNGMLVSAGSAVVSLTDSTGTAVITVINGTASRTYTVTIRKFSSTAGLSELLVSTSNSYSSSGIGSSSNLPLTPDFEAETTNYVAAAYDRSFHNIWPTAADSNATVKVYAVANVKDKNAGDEIAITATNGGHNRYAIYFAADANDAVVNVCVISEDGAAEKTYRVVLQKVTTRTVTIGATANGSGIGGGTYDNGASVTVVATPAAGYTFGGWYNGSTLVSQSPSYTFAVTADITLTPHFMALEQYYLEIATVGAGSVTVNGGAQVSSNYKELYIKGTQIALTATADSGYYFAYWQDVETSSVISTNTVYQTVMGTGINVKAVFYRTKTDAATSYTVVFQDKSGRILKSTDVPRGGNAVPPANPTLVGYVFTGWDKGYTNVASDLTISPIFVRADQTYALTVVNGTTSDGLTTGAYRFDYPVTVIAGPAPEGMVFGCWTQDGIKVSTEATYTFYMPMRATTMTAVYVEKDAAVNAPFISLSNDVLIDTANRTMLFTATRSVPEGYTLVESGVLLLKSDTAPSELTVETPNAIHGKIANTSTEQFYIRKSNVGTGDTWYARAYLIYRDNNGNIITVYSENTVSATMG
jgi:uncharacterized repeat protein (TIGR02543 family)